MVPLGLESLLDLLDLCDVVASVDVHVSCPFDPAVLTEGNVGCRQVEVGARVCLLDCLDGALDEVEEVAACLGEGGGRVFGQEYGRPLDSVSMRSTFPRWLSVIWWITSAIDHSPSSGFATASSSLTSAMSPSSRFHSARARLMTWSGPFAAFS
jgi:hypothetical protein